MQTVSTKHRHVPRLPVIRRRGLSRVTRTMLALALFLPLLTAEATQPPAEPTNSPAAPQSDPMESVPASAEPEAPERSADTSAGTSLEVDLISQFGPFEKVVVIPIEGTIDGALATSLDRRVEAAKEEGADCIVFEIDTYGGEVFAAERITNTIFPLPPRTETEEGIHTIGYVKEKAISAGALIAFSCREIIMQYGSRMGDCEPITLAGADGVTTLPEKFQSPLRAKFRTFAQRNGYPVAIAEAMVTKELGVVLIRFEDEEEADYYTVLESEAWPESKRARIASEEIVLLKGQLPTFNDSESIQYGLSNGTVRDRADLLARLGVTDVIGAEAPVLEMNWSEELVRFLQAFKFIFFIIGVVALYLEFKSPGFGVPGVLGLIAMAIVFGSSYLSGLAETWEILLFFAGVILLAVEIFIFPGFGIPGVLGLFLILMSFYLATQPFIIPNSDKESPSAPFEMQMFKEWFIQFGVSLVVVIIVISLLARYLPKTRWFGRLILAPATPSGSPPAAPQPQVSTGLLGATGVALTTLRPAGRAEIGERRMEVVTRGGYIEAGDAVEVCEVHGNRVVVKKRIS